MKSFLVRYYPDVTCGRIAECWFHAYSFEDLMEVIYDWPTMPISRNRSLLIDVTEQA